MASIFELIAQGDIEGLRAALDADPAAAMSRDSSGASAIMVSAYYGKTDARDLVRAHLPGLDPHEAIIVGELPPTAGWDPDTPSPDGFTPLALAAFFGNAAAFDQLLPLTADINRRADNGQQVAALHAATAVRRADMVEKLLRAGADPNLPQADGFTPLHVADEHGDTVIVSLLLLFGADRKAVNAKGKDAAAHARAGGHDWLAELLQN